MHRGGTILLGILLAGCSSTVPPSVSPPPSSPPKFRIRGLWDPSDPPRQSLPRIVVAHGEHEEAGSSPSPVEIRRHEGVLVPSFTVVPVGTDLQFQNDEDIYHQFFSSSEGNEFEGTMLEPGSAGTVSLRSPGIIHVYCSLHAEKQATIIVVPSRRFQVLPPNGLFAFPDLEPGTYVVETWNQDGREQTASVSLPSDEAERLYFPSDSGDGSDSP